MTLIVKCIHTEAKLLPPRYVSWEELTDCERLSLTNMQLRTEYYSDKFKSLGNGDWEQITCVTSCPPQTKGMRERNCCAVHYECECCSCCNGRDQCCKWRPK